MAKPLSKWVFPSLAVGLAKYTENKQKYPYPDELLYALHHLSLAMRTSFPATITEFFERCCKKPLEEWWPDKSAFTGIDGRFELLEQDGDLGQQVIEYLKTHKFPDNISPLNIQEKVDSERMGKIVGKARQAASYDPDGAQREYVATRSYVITHPWTTTEKLRELRHQHHIPLEEVGDLYQESSSVGLALLYKGPDQPKPCYWNCSVCGPLYQRNDQLGSIKPGACEKRCPGSQTWQHLDTEDNTRVLKRGVHLYTHIPGITEMKLYRWLIDEILPMQRALQEVELWPGIDRYDLRLTFRGSVWAVDVKDYKDPFSLGNHIKQDPRHPEQEDPRWNKWFYVYPTYRKLQRPNYGDCVRRTTDVLPANVSILSAEHFKELVRTHL